MKINYDEHKSFIDALIESLNDSQTDLSNVFSFYDNVGLKKFFKAYYESKYKDTVKKTIQATLKNYNLYYSQRKEFLPLVFLREYQIITGKNKEEAVYDLYVPDINNQQYLLDVENNTHFYKDGNEKILTSIINHKRYYYEQNKIIDEILNILNNLSNILIIADNQNSNNINDLIEQMVEIEDELNTLPLTENDSIYLLTIKDKIFDLINDCKENYSSQIFFNYGIQYLILSMACLEQFKNQDFYLIHNEFIDEHILNILKGVFNSDEKFLIDIKSNNYYCNEKSLIDTIKKKNYLFIHEINQLVFTEQSETTDVFSPEIYKDKVLDYLLQVRMLNRFVQNNNIDSLLSYIDNNWFSDNSKLTITVGVFTSTLLSIPEIYSNNIKYMKKLEYQIQQDIFNYKLINNLNLTQNHYEEDFYNGEDIENMNNSLDLMTPFQDVLPDEYKGIHLKNFIDTSLQDIANVNTQIEKISQQSKYNDETYKNLRRNIHTIKGNCLVIGLKNLSEPYYLLENIIDEKIQSEEIIIQAEMTLIQLINQHFKQILTDYFSKNIFEINTPVLRIQQLLNEATGTHNELSSQFRELHNIDSIYQKNEDIFENESDSPSSSPDDIYQSLLDDVYEESNISDPNDEDNSEYIPTQPENKTTEFLNIAESQLDKSITVIETKPIQLEQPEDIGIMNVTFDENEFSTLNTAYFQNKLSNPNNIYEQPHINDMENQDNNIVETQKEDEIITAAVNDKLADLDSFLESIEAEKNNMIDNTIDKTDNSLNINHSENVQDNVSLNSNEINNDINESLSTTQDELLNESHNLDTNLDTLTFESNNLQNNAINDEIAQNIDDEDSIPIDENLHQENSVMIDTVLSPKQENNQQYIIEKQVVYVEKPSHSIQTLGVINFDSEQQVMLINNQKIISVNDWGVIVSNTKFNVETLWDYFSEINSQTSQGNDVYLIEESIIPFVNNLINDTEQIHLFKTSAMLIKFKIYLLHLISYRFSYDSDVHSIAFKVLNGLDSFIVQGHASSNHESFDNIIALIEVNQSALELQILEGILQNKISDSLKTSEYNLTTLINKTIEEVKSNGKLFDEHSKSFNKFKLRSDNYITSTSETIKNIDNAIENLQYGLEAEHKKNEERINTINKNIKIFYNKFKEFIFIESNSKNKTGLFDRLFRSKPKPTKLEDEDD